MYGLWGPVSTLGPGASQYLWAAKEESERREEENILEASDVFPLGSGWREWSCAPPGQGSDHPQVVMIRLKSQMYEILYIKNINLMDRCNDIAGYRWVIQIGFVILSESSLFLWALGSPHYGCYLYHLLVSSSMAQLHLLPAGQSSSTIH